jgi:hypothetical protein
MHSIKRRYHQGMSQNWEFYQQCYQHILISQMSPIHVLLKHFLRFIHFNSFFLSTLRSSKCITCNRKSICLSRLSNSCYIFLSHTCLWLTRIKFLLLTFEVPLCNITGKEFLVLPPTPQAAGAWFETAKLAGRKNKNSIALYSYVTVT